MQRLTQYDEMRHCYVIKPDAEQGQNIQRLGMYEDRDERKPVKIIGKKKEGCRAECPACDMVLAENNLQGARELEFCFHCGQKLDWSELIGG